MTTFTRSSLLRVSALAAAAILFGAGCAAPSATPSAAQPTTPPPTAQAPAPTTPPPTSAPLETTNPTAAKPTTKPKTTTVVPHTSTVLITNFEFSPQVIAITTGDTVVWTNKDPMSHTTKSDNLVWDTGNIAPGASGKHTFTSPGTYAYHCGIHPNMKGTVVVRDAVK